MFKCQRYIFLLFIVALVFNSFSLNYALAFTVKVPIITEVNQEVIQRMNQPLIIGLTQPGTEVMIYIDGEYVGLANVNQENTGTDNFYFQLTTALSVDRHTVIAIAKDKTSLILSPPTKEIEFYVTPIPAPTLIKPNEETVIGKVKPLITGLTISESHVYIYIDGVYNGKIENLIHQSGTANFAYVPFLNLSVGHHTAWAVAEDESGRKSQPSNILQFSIEEPMPAPTLFTPVVNSHTTYDQPFVVGLAKNDSLIKVYIDHQLDGQFKVENHQSGAANFAYKPFLPLTKGGHLLYMEAIDSEGKVSIWSNIIYFNITRPIQPTITEEAAEEEKVEVLSEILPFEEEAGEEEDITETEAGEIEELLKPSAGEEVNETGLIDESKEQQSKLKLNLIIFILFLIAVIAWIFWVNRELIKERRAKSKEDIQK